MKFISLTENFIHGLQAALQVVSKNPTLPVLGSVRFQTQDGVLTVSGTNLEIGVTSMVRGRVELDGVCVVDGRVVLEYVRLLRSERVTLEVRDTQLLVSGEDGAVAEFKVVSAEDFPVIPQVPVEQEVVVRDKDMMIALQKTVFAASSDEARPEIYGVYTRVEGQELVLVATDSSRLSEARAQVVSGVWKEGVIIPLRTAQEIQKLLKGSEEEVHLILGGAQLSFKTGSTELVSRLVEGQFPPYEQIVPNNPATTLVAQQSDLVAAFKRAAVFSQPEGGELLLRIQSGAGLVMIEAKHQRFGSHQSTLQAAITGVDVTVSFNVRFVLEGLSIFPSDAQITWSFTDAVMPSILRAEHQSGFYIVMPIRQ